MPSPAGNGCVNSTSERPPRIGVAAKLNLVVTCVAAVAGVIAAVTGILALIK